MHPSEQNSAEQTQKRGRGRPRLENALTPAQRAKRYRDRLRQRRNAGGREEEARVTKNAVPHDGVSNGHVQPQDETLAALKRDLHRANQQIADLRGLVHMFIDARMKQQAIPADVFRNICQSFLAP